MPVISVSFGLEKNPGFKLTPQLLIRGVYAAFFGSHKPARVVVPTRALHHGALVEIEAVAELKN